MVTIDLNIEQRWDEVFQRVEAGEPVQVMRGDRLVAVVEPAAIIAEDEAYLRQLADLGAKQLAAVFPANEFSDWDKSDGAR